MTKTQDAGSVVMHDLKTDREVFTDSWSGCKPWEIRNNDRGFKVGDMVNLRETVYSGAEMTAGDPLRYSDRTIHGTITNIVSGYGLQDGWVILTIDHMVRFWGAGALPHPDPEER